MSRVITAAAARDVIQARGFNAMFGPIMVLPRCAVQTFLGYYCETHRKHCSTLEATPRTRRSRLPAPPAVFHSLYARHGDVSKCRQTGKVRFRTYKTASAALARCVERRRRRFQTWRMERSVYLCEHCDSWHLSSWPGRTR